MYSELEVEGNTTGFKIFTIESQSTLPILDGAMKITCGENAMAVKARICTHRDFAAVHASIIENNGVRLSWDRKESEIKYFSGHVGSSC